MTAQITPEDYCRLKYSDVNDKYWESVKVEDRLAIASESFPSDEETAWFENVMLRIIDKTSNFEILHNKGSMTTLTAKPDSREFGVIEKAKTMLGKGIVYKLGTGGRNPNNASPATFKDGILGCDCAGFVSWAWGFDRFQDYSLWNKKAAGQFNSYKSKDGNEDVDYIGFNYYGGWINTDSMLEDAFDNNADWFTHLDAPIPGSIICFGSTGSSTNRRIGHEGLVIEAPVVFDRENPDHWKLIKVIDCRSAKPAILVRDGMTWFGKDRAGRPKQSQFVYPVFCNPGFKSV